MSEPSQTYGRSVHWGWRLAYTSPALILCFSSLTLLVQGETVDGLAALAVVFALAAVPTLFDTTGRFPSLILGFLIWLVFGGVLIVLLVPEPLWLTGLLLGLGVLALMLATLRIGQGWGWRRYDAMAAQGRPMREWQWVYVDASFVRAYFNQTPARRWLILFKLVWSVYPAVSLVALSFYFNQAGPDWMPSLDQITGYWLMLAWVNIWAAFWVRVLLAIGSLVGLWREWRGTYRMMLWQMVLDIPVAIVPLIFVWLWSESTTANLLYARRFERLVPLRDAQSEASL